MATGSISPGLPTDQFRGPAPFIDYDKLVTEDDAPVDSFYSERQHQLLTTTLIDSWKGPGKGGPFWITTDVGLFFDVNVPAFSPDVLLSLGVSTPRRDLKLKENRSYFIWKYLKPPDAVIEVVSNTIGGELTTKLTGYARIGVTYYIVWDNFHYLSDTKLYCFKLEDGKYVPCDRWFPELELGVKIWEGEYATTEGTFLRWCDREDNVIPTGTERADEAELRADQLAHRADYMKQRAEQEKLRAEQEKLRANEAKERADEETRNAEREKRHAEQERQRADEQKSRAEKLAEKLRALGIDPDQP